MRRERLAVRPLVTLAQMEGELRRVLVDLETLRDIGNDCAPLVIEPDQRIVGDRPPDPADCRRCPSRPTAKCRRTFPRSRSARARKGSPEGALRPAADHRRRPSARSGASEYSIADAAAAVPASSARDDARSADASFKSHVVLPFFQFDCLVRPVGHPVMRRAKPPEFRRVGGECGRVVSGHEFQHRRPSMGPTRRGRPCRQQRPPVIASLGQRTALVLRLRRTPVKHVQLPQMRLQHLQFLKACRAPAPRNRLPVGEEVVVSPRHRAARARRRNARSACCSDIRR